MRLLDKLRGSCTWAAHARHASKTSNKGNSTDPSAGIKSAPLSRSTDSAIALWRATASKDHQRTEYARSVARRSTSETPRAFFLTNCARKYWEWGLHLP